MPFAIRYKRAAAAEVEAAIRWYMRPEIHQAAAFVRDLERSEAHLRARPTIYQKVEGEVRRAVLRRFPYSIFFVVENNEVIVLAFMHHHRRPRSRADLLKT